MRFRVQAFITEHTGLLRDLLRVHKLSFKSSAQAELWNLFVCVNLIRGGGYAPPYLAQLVTPTEASNKYECYSLEVL